VEVQHLEPSPFLPGFLQMLPRASDYGPSSATRRYNGRRTPARR